MNKNNQSWRLLLVPYNESVHETLLQQHHAVQFIAMAGRHLIPQRNDDSNTSMDYNYHDQLFVGEELSPGKRAALDLLNLEMGVLDEVSNSFRGISLTNKKRSEAYSAFREILKNTGFPYEDMKDELHYDLPQHGLLSGSTFQAGEPGAIRENISYRYNAQYVLQEIIKDFSEAEPVRIWPHHFDTGSLIPLQNNKPGDVTQSIGLGWAIPDAMVSEPYYYLSIWSAESIDFPDKIPSLDKGSWMMPQWNGGVLRLSEILKNRTEQDQLQAVLSFFNSGLEIANTLLKQ